MIQSFRHKGLQRFYEKNERKGLPPVLVDKISRILARLDIATVPEQMALPALKASSSERRVQRLLVGLRYGKLANYFQVRWGRCGRGRFD